MRVASPGVALVAALVAACAGAPAKPAPQMTAAATAKSPCPTGPTFASGADRATLWMRNSSEYRAATLTTYRAALESLKQALADPAWTAEPTQAGDLSSLPPAVIMDVDDTILDNSGYEAELLLKGTCYEAFEASWDAWIAEHDAPAVAGAVEFIRSARALHDPAGRAVRVFFITNRECETREGSGESCPQKADTAANLAGIGLATPTLDEELMLRGERPGWDGEKLARRSVVAAGHRILLVLGDDLADFLPEVRRQDVADRDRARCSREDWWGTRWFQLPNPIYGSWLVATGSDLTAALAADPGVFRDCP